MGMNEKIKERITELLETICFKDKDGCFYADIYADYRDEFPGETLRKITDADDSQAMFDECLYEAYEDAQWCAEDEVISSVRADARLQELIQADSMTDEDFRMVMLEMFYVAIPYDHYLRQDVLIDILVDAGDLNTDYTANCFGPHYAARGNKIPEESGILWLVRQQGYKKSGFEKFLDAPVKDQDFLYSVYTELENCTTSMNVLSFLAKMTLEEYFKLQKAIGIEKSKNKSCYPTKRKGRGYITLSMTTTCGLYDPFCGAGGLLEIKLDKDVRLPVRLIESAKQDGARGYSIQEIFGVTSALWTDNAIKEIHGMSTPKIAL